MCAACEFHLRANVCDLCSVARAKCCPSSDEEDEDFVPDDIDSEDEAVKRKNAPKSKKKRGRVRGAAAAAEDDSEDDADGNADQEEPVVPEHKRLEKKAKMDDLWSKLNANTSAKPKPAVNLAALCKPVTAKAKDQDKDQVNLILHD